jgi:hypothetical protein
VQQIAGDEHGLGVARRAGGAGEVATHDPR